MKRLKSADEIELVAKYYKGAQFSQKDKLMCLTAYYDILDDYGIPGAAEHWRLINEGNLDNDYARIFDRIKDTVMTTIDRGTPPYQKGPWRI